MKIKVALISMPWSSPEFPSIQIGLLKSILTKNKISVNVYHFYLKFVKYIGLDNFIEISKYRDGLVAEWIFNYELFGDFSPDKFHINYIEYLKENSFINSKNITIADKIQEIRRTIAPDFLDECENIINTKNYDLIGFSCTFNQFLPSLCLAKKKQPKLKNCFWRFLF